MSNQLATSRLVDADTGRIVVAKLEVANTFWRRFVGLQFRQSLPSDSGLLLTPCNSVHTFFLRFAIDIAFIDAEGYVLKVVSNVPPWRIVPPVRGAASAIETAGGMMNLTVGSQVVVD